MKIGERYSEKVICGLKFLISIETACFAALIWANFIVIDRFDLRLPIYYRSLRYDLYQWYLKGNMAIFILQMTIVYFAGAFIRRKLKLNSILLCGTYDTKNEKIRQKIVELMKNEPTADIEHIAIFLDLELGHTEAYIRALKKSGQVSCEGGWTNRRWVVKDSRANEII